MTAKPVDSKAIAANDKNVPFSVHNPSDHLTPSPYLPWTQPNAADAEGNDLKRDTSLANAVGNAHVKNVAKSQQLDYRDAQNKPRIFTVVLQPTDQSKQAEYAYYATTPDPRTGNRKQSAAGVPRTPASATMPHPATPLSAVPSTPGTSGPPNKKQKMLVGPNEIHNFQSKIIEKTAAPLFLDPVDNLQDVQKLLQQLTDPRNQDCLPAPKTRKRTVAELAADEALAAQEQRFMLIMDERLSASASGGVGVKASAADGDGGAASFEPRFERFKLIDQIRLEHEAKKRHDREMVEQQKAAQMAAEKARMEQARQQQHAQQEHHAQQERAKEAMRIKNNQAITQAQINALASRQHQQQQQHAAQQAAQQAQASQAPTSNNVIANGQVPHIVSASQSHHSSPVVRNNTPHSASSPMIGHVTQAGGVPMKATSSGQGVTSSPARPPSAMQHGHPGGGIQMIHQRSQQGPSRRGTPQMSNGTPNMPHVTPVMPSATPTRMGHGSPPIQMTHTPVMNASVAAAQHMQAQSIGIEQQQRIFQQKQEQQRRLAESQRQIQMNNHLAQMQSNSPQQPQMSPDQRMTNGAHQLQQQQLNHAYREQLNRARQMQMAGLSGSPHPGQANPHSHPQQPHPGAQLLPGQQIPRGMPPQPHPQPNGQPLNSLQMQIRQYSEAKFRERMNVFATQFGGQIPPDKMNQARAVAMEHSNKATQALRENMARKQQEQRMLALQNAQMMQGAGMGGMNGMNGMNGMGGGMNAMGGMGMNGMGGMQ